MANALVIAANSFLGRHLCAELAACGHRVAATVRRPLDDFPEAHICHLEDASQVERIIVETRPDWIVQCAGATQNPEPEELYGTHVQGALHVLRAARAHVPDAVTVFFGSAAEYGPAPPEALPLSETVHAEPRGFFGHSKLSQTCVATSAAEAWGLRVLVIRPANIVGPGLPDHYLASALARRLLAAPGAELAVVNGEATRDFVDVRDVARAIRLLLTKAPPASGQAEIFNVASSHETPVLDVARRLGEFAGGVCAIDAGAAGSRGGIQRSALSSAKLEQATGWRPEISLDQSLTDLWRALRHALEASAE